jgi:hypothetical protein
MQGATREHSPSYVTEEYAADGAPAALECATDSASLGITVAQWFGDGFGFSCNRRTGAM